MKVLDGKKTEAVSEVTDFLQTIWQLMEDGRIATLQPDPFYPRNGVLTKEVVEGVVSAIEFDVFEFEIQKYPGYHKEHQQLEPGEKLVRPGFTELPYPQQLALVQGLDRITQCYRA